MEDIVYVPTCNLSEVVHASWLASMGFQGSIDLYEAAVNDLSQALLQSTKSYAFNRGRYHGSGPSAQKLASRVARGQSSCPQNVARMVTDAVMGTPMQAQQPKEKEQVARSVKQKKPITIQTEESNATHRLDYIFVEPPQNQRAQGMENEDTTDDNNIHVCERQVHKTMWAIRRIPKGSRVQCQGWLGNGRGKCQKNIPNRGGGAVAPSFWGVRVWGDVHGHTCGHQGSKAQFMWFCPDNVDHTWQTTSSITHAPARIPIVWPVEEGTNIIH